MRWDEKLKLALERRGHSGPAARSREEAERFSSVLILLGNREGTDHDVDILLTKRTMLVESHKGQVSFPGGVQEPHDESSLATALRECEEEIGVSRADVEILGNLQPVYTRGSILIFPWVGRVRFPYPFSINAAEVERILFLKLQTLLEDGLSPVSVPVEGLSVKSIGIYAERELVWGATAKMLEELRTVFLTSKLNPKG